MAEINRRWIYPTITASENKGIERIALSGEGLAHEVVGIDGSRKFGCRPLSGFKKYRYLNIDEDFSGLADPPPVFNQTSIVTDCYPVHFQIREGEFGYGFVYRVKGDSATTGAAAVLMDYYPTNAVDGSTGWRTVLISDHSTTDVSATAKMEVISMGRYVFTFVKGRATRVFYVDYEEGGSPEYTHKVLDGGPGDAPVLLRSAETNPFNAASVPPRPNSNPAFTSTTPSWAKIFRTSSDPDDTATNPDRDYNNFAPGDYSFAYYLHDSVTGRRSALSTIVQYSEDNDPIPTGGRYIGITFDVDTDKYDQIFLFRSVKLQSVGGTYSGSILHLDNIYDFGDLTDTTPSDAPYTGTNWKVLTAYYELEDIALAMQDIYLDKVAYDSEMPYAGAATHFEGSLIVSDPDGPTGESSYGPFQLAVSLDRRVRNIGEIRWSSLTEWSPELFPINNKYSPDIYQNRITKLVRAGEFAIGFSSDRLYHIRRNGIYLRIEDLHAGFGLVGPNAVCTAGPLVYFVTNKGLKAVANNGQIDDVQALDNLLLEDWYNDLPDLRLSYDPYASCLFILNPNEAKTVCMWFGSGRISEIHDVPFADVRCGIAPRDGEASPTKDTVMVEKAYFLQNAPTTNQIQTPLDWKPRVMTLDYDRDKVAVSTTDLSPGDPVLRTMDFSGDSIFTVHSVGQLIPNGYKMVLKSGKTTPSSLSPSSDLDLIGGFVYVMSSESPSRVGRKAQIINANGGTVTVDGTYGGGGQAFITIKSDAGWRPDPGDVIGVSPVFFRYVGGALPMIRTEDNQVVSSMDLFQNKQVSSVGCHFSDVSGGTPGYKFFRGLVYNTELDSAAVSSIPVDFSGTIIGESIKNGESEDYAAFTATGIQTRGRHGIQDSALNPGIEIFCPDVDYKLMAVICRGRTTNTDTSERNT